LNGKVDKVTGKQLSTEDYTSAEKTKLSNIEANAAVNLIESISVNNTTVSPVNKNVNIPIKTINNESLLGTGNIDTSSGGGTWGNIGGTLSDQTDLQTALDAKQGTLVSGTNIKTINNESLLGSGDISISEPIKILPLYYYEDEEDPEYNLYTNDVIDYNDKGYGIANGAYVVDTSICTQPYPEGIDIYFGYRGKGNTYQEQDFQLKHGDIVIVNHASDTVYSVGDRITVISNGLVYTSVVTEVSTATKPGTKLTTTHSLDQMAHHITANAQNRHLFTDEININDVDLTKDFDFGTGTIGSATFPAGTLFFLRYDSTISPTHLKNPGIIITPNGDMYKVTSLATLVITGTKIVSGVDLTSNQTIGGVKTFSSVPVCATQPTSNNELANKAYVDDVRNLMKFSNWTNLYSSGSNVVKYRYNAFMVDIYVYMSDVHTSSIDVGTLPSAIRPSEFISSELTGEGLNYASINTIVSMSVLNRNAYAAGRIVYTLTN
jgi:hypothetical protein